MTQSFYTAKVSIAAQQQRVNTIANNIANISTYAFKGTRVDFKDTLYSEMQNPEEPGSNSNLLCGNGVLIGATTHSFIKGIANNTGNEMDFYIDGDGFFTTIGKDGLNQYTRNGCFAVSNEADANYLVTAQGRYVLDTDLQKIEIPENIDSINVGENGELFAEDGVIFAKLNIAKFTNKDGLSSVGNSGFSATEASGSAISSDAKIKQGYIEASNVDLSLEMTRLLRAQKAFSLAGKALVISDEMVASANNMRT